MKQLIFALTLLPLTAHAEGIVTKVKTVECYCTDSGGSRVELGESICLQVGGRMFTAQCQMSLNVPMWRETEEGCLTGSNAQELPLSPFSADTLQHPVQTLAIDPEV
ncbi:hypothetical protein [uncultured Sulfitobacter sp.]|uniref:hypothetical protein n=1 Tax=uncultured Sulfitobacter sp. TaxID=191468 RepID=UPI00262DFC27|nr:hypothetical protein [uncultured Sulfitobacter sp.]